MNLNNATIYKVVSWIIAWNRHRKQDALSQLIMVHLNHIGNNKLHMTVGEYNRLNCGMIAIYWNRVVSYWCQFCRMHKEIDGDQIWTFYIFKDQVTNRSTYTNTLKLDICAFNFAIGYNLKRDRTDFKIEHSPITNILSFNKI